MSDERIEAIRQRRANNYGVHRVPPDPREGALAYMEARDDVRYMLDHIAALEDVRDAAAEAVHAAKYPRDLVGNAYATKKLEETLAAAGQGETKNAPADT